MKILSSHLMKALLSLQRPLYAYAGAGFEDVSQANSGAGDGCGWRCTNSCKYSCDDSCKEGCMGSCMESCTHTALEAPRMLWS